ncbi:MAG: hypothetical protein ACD_23C00751G0012 [uncultured bacterium]|jgi:hypothetical protein|nr:MAG: hypothetical protein ACD_23C00751G0012 [uncultured bacterium]
MFKLSGNSQIDRLNHMALVLAKKGEAGFGVLSTGEQCYVALASNRIDLLEQIGYTIPEALARISEWIPLLIASWEYAGNPAKYESAEGK